MTDSPAATPPPKPRRGRPRRTDPASPGLEQIVAAVVALAGNGTCLEINMRDVAGALNVSPKLIYRHVSGKAELLELASSSVLSQWVQPPADAPWPERLTRIITETHQLLRRYPALAEPSVLRDLSARGSPQSTRAAKAITDCFVDAGLSQAEAERIFTLHVIMLLGELTLDKAIRTGALPSQRTPSAEAIIKGLESALHWLIAGIRSQRPLADSPPTQY